MIAATRAPVAEAIVSSIATTQSKAYNNYLEPIGAFQWRPTIT